jgi:hypothetical protein
VEEYRLRNGTVYAVLAIGEDGAEEQMLPLLEARVAEILGTGAPEEPFPYMNDRVADALRTSGPLATLNGSTYVLTERGLRLYHALIDLIYEAKGRGVARKAVEVKSWSPRGSRRARARRSKALEEQATAPS